MPKKVNSGLLQEANTTMREFELHSLPPVPILSSSEIRKIREDTKTSQAVFAHYLNVTLSSVQKWETGSKRPNGAALKLLNLVHRKGLESIK